jgi:hypothetical protein
MPRFRRYSVHAFLRIDSNRPDWKRCPQPYIHGTPSVCAAVVRRCRMASLFSPKDCFLPVFSSIQSHGSHHLASFWNGINSVGGSGVGRIRATAGSWSSSWGSALRLPLLIRDVAHSSSTITTMSSSRGRTSWMFWLVLAWEAKTGSWLYLVPP